MEQAYYMPYNPLAAIIIMIIGMAWAVCFEETWGIVWAVISNPLKALFWLITAPFKMMRGSTKGQGLKPRTQAG